MSATGQQADCPPYLSRQIKTEAKRLGFSALGIAPAALEQPLINRLLARPQPPYVPWAPDLRTDARLQFPEARSVLVGAVSFRQRIPAEGPGDGQGYIAPFAQAPDYHQTIAARLGQLAACLHRLRPELKYKIQVDSGPACERLYALRAGVGWQGKNNFIIVPGVGSFVWLGLLITNLPLDYDVPLANQCGDCDLCLRACPTAAYTGANAYEHKRCLAYWLTCKQAFSPAQIDCLKRHRLIYGCDYCQLACPHNPPGEAPGCWPDLCGLLSLSKQGLTAYFRGSAALWRGSNTLLRNLVVAAADVRDCQDSLKRLAARTGLAAETAGAVLASDKMQAEQGDGQTK